MCAIDKKPNIYRNMKKKILSFVLLCLAIVGSIGGVGYACYNHAWIFCASVLSLTYLAWPKIKECFTNLTE